MLPGEATLRARVGERRRIFDTLIEADGGQPVAQRTADGRFVDPIILTPAVRLDAAKHLRASCSAAPRARRSRWLPRAQKPSERQSAHSTSELQKRIAAAWRLPALPEDAVLVPQAPASSAAARLQHQRYGPRGVEATEDD